MQEPHAFELRAGPFLRGELSVVEFSGQERISGLFDFHVTFLTHEDWREVQPLLLGQPAMLSMAVPSAPPRVVQGIAAKVELLGARRRDGRLARELRMRIVPKLWLLRRRRNSRIFQDMTVVDVVAKVLAEADIPHRWATNRSYPRRAYCLQYEETDYDFVRRVCAEDGVFFYFEQPSGRLLAALGNTDSIVAEATSAVDAVAPSLGLGAAAGATRLAETVVFASSTGGYGVIDSGGDAGPVIEGLGVAAAAIPGVAIGGLIPAPSVPYVERKGAERGEGEHVYAFTLAASVRPNAAQLTDYDFTRPLLSLKGNVGKSIVSVAPGGLGSLPSASVLASGVSSAPLSAPAGHDGEGIANWLGSRLAELGQTALEVYDHRGDYEEPDAANAMATLHLEQHRADAIKGRGESTCRRFAPGLRFRLAEHLEPALNVEYAVVAVRHVGRTPEERRDEAIETTYENRFDCVPAEIAYRPKRPRVRLQQVVETAVVTGPGGEEIYTDAYGRIKVQFHWDREGLRNEYSSCWIRVSQTWAGAGWGSQFIPRIGMEVVVTFIGGDVDRPLVTGCVYNGTHPTPFLLPQSASHSGIRTQSTPGGSGFNELSFVDSRGHELVYVRGERDMALDVGHDQTTRVGRNKQTTVRGAEEQDVALDRSIRVGGHEAVAIGNDRNVSVKGSDRLAVSGNRVEIVRGVRAVQAREAAVTTSGTETHSVLGDLMVTVGADGRDDSATTSRHSTKVHGDLRQYATGNAYLRADESIVLECGTSRITLEKSKITLAADAIVATAAKSFSAKGKGPALQLTDSAELSSDAIKLVSKGGYLTLDKGQAKMSGPSVNVSSGDDPPERDDDKRDAETQHLKYRMLDEELKPYAGKNYTLVTEGFRAKGKTDGEGYVEHDVPKGVSSAQIVVWTASYPTGPRLVVDVALHTLPAASDARGAMLRLRNLGYYNGPLSDEATMQLESAIEVFQADHGLPVTGKLDGPTVSKLQEVHPEK